MNRITFEVYDMPRPGGSKSGTFNYRLKRVIIFEACKKNKYWRRSVADAAKKVFKRMMLGPLKVIVVFVMPRPKNQWTTKGELKAWAPRHHITKPDSTKLWRSTEDALTSIAWLDDSQIVNQHVRKVYQKHPSDPIGSYIRIVRLREPQITEKTRAHAPKKTKKRGKTLARKRK